MALQRLYQQKGRLGNKFWRSAAKKIKILKIKKLALDKARSGWYTQYAVLISSVRRSVSVRCSAVRCPSGGCPEPGVLVPGPRSPPPGGRASGRAAPRCRFGRSGTRPLLVKAWWRAPAPARGLLLLGFLWSFSRPGGADIPNDAGILYAYYVTP